MMAMQILVILFLSVFVIRNVTSNTKNTAIDNMQTIVQERSKIIENHVKQTEGILTAYSRAGEIKEILKNPKDPEAVAAVQAYTETFSADVENLE